jgi:hypothetical protein
MKIGDGFLRDFERAQLLRRKQREIIDHTKFLAETQRF